MTLSKNVVTYICHGQLFNYVISYRGKDPSTLFVRCGDWDIVKEIEPLASQERGVYEVRIHPEYPRDLDKFTDKTRARHQDNIALLFVSEPFEMADHVNKICLPSSVNRSKKEEYWSSIFNVKCETRLLEARVNSMNITSSSRSAMASAVCLGTDRLDVM